MSPRSPRITPANHDGRPFGGLLQEPGLDAAAYARTSTPQQKSCAAQLDCCRRLITERKWNLRFQLKDEGLKGSQDDRPAYMRLLELAEEGRIQAIVVWKLDRACRSLREASSLQERLAKWGVAIVSYTEPFDTTTSMGRYFLGSLANASQLETDILRERAQLGHERRVLEGRWSGAHVPFGYSRDEKSGKLAVAKAEKSVLLTMHQKYARLKGDGPLASWLNDHGYTYRGGEWTADRARRALTNPIAVGDLTVRGVMQHHDHLELVSRARFRQTMRYRDQLRYKGTQHTGRIREKAIEKVFSAYLNDLKRAREDDLGVEGAGVTA